jgi:phosphohistidine phosphatase
MNRIHFLRHGEADHAGPATWTHDSQRPLTAEGRARMTAEARGMKGLGIAIDVIVSSPYLRCRQTAEEVALVYRLADRMVESELLEPGGSFKDFRKTLVGIEGDSILVVGHSPDLGSWVGQLTGTGDVHLGKGTLAWVEIDGRLREETGTLKALLPADLLVSAGRLVGI